MQSVSDLHRVLSQSSRVANAALIATSCMDTSSSSSHMASVHADIDAVKATVTEVQGTVVEAKSDVSQVKSDVAEVKAIMLELSATAITKSQSESQSQSLKQTLTTQINQSIDAVTNVHNEMTQTVSKMQNQIDTLQNRVIDAENELSTTRTKLATLSTIVSFGTAARKISVSNTLSAFVMDDKPDGNPKLHLLSGLTYAFDLSRNPNHPFIVCGAQDGEPLTEGFVHVDTETGAVTIDAQANIGHTSGLLYWTIPVTQDDCVYESTIDSSFTGNIIF